MISGTTWAQNNVKITHQGPLTIGEKIEFASDILNENRVLNIYLPQDYNRDSSKLYPVIYLLDGSIDEDFIHIAGIVQFASFSWINMIPESILVGIANTDRKRDFTYPTDNQEDQVSFPTSGNSAPFINALENEIIPLIHNNYNVSATKTIIGQSLGGLLATQILFQKPDLFDNYIIASPSLWWNDKSLLDTAPNSYDSNKSIYIAVGKEGYGMEELAEELYDLLVSKKFENSKISFKYFEE